FTDTPTATFTRTPTPTPIPTETPTLTITLTPSPTIVELGILPTPVGTPSSGSTGFVVGNCVPPSGWTTYVVQRGNTLFSIARAVGSTVGELRAVNCIPNADNIYAGQVLYVPSSPQGPVLTSVPVAYPTLAARPHSSEGCTDPSTRITSPSNG